jgi:predicted permease
MAQARAPGLGIWLGNLGRDLRFSFRSLRRAPGFSAAVIVTLALCIGANTAILSVLYQLLLKPLPFRDPGQLVQIYNAYPKSGLARHRVSVAQYLDYKANADLFAGFSLTALWSYTIGEESDPTRGSGESVTGDFFTLLDVHPLRGRFFAPEDSVPGRDHVVVLTQSLWENYYRADPEIVGKQIRLSGDLYTIVGVAPRVVEELDTQTQLFRPITWTPNQTEPAARHWDVAPAYARMKPGVRPAAARAQLDLLEQRYYQQADPESRQFIDSSGFRIALGRVRDEQTQSVRTGLFLLQGGVLLVLLIGCVNVANLMLARSNARQAELAIRQALGAGRGSLARQLFAETLLLTLAGAAGGMALAWGGLRVVNSYLAGIVRNVAPVALDGTILGLTLLLSLLVALLVGLLPVINLWRSDLLARMQSGARGASGGSRVRTASGILVVSQVAIALMLLVGAGLLLRSFARVLEVDPGFEARKVGVGRVAPPLAYRTQEQKLALEDLMLARLREIPGLEAVSMASDTPLPGPFVATSFTPRGNPGQSVSSYFFAVSPGFFSTMGMRWREGRDFSEADNAKSRPVIIVDRIVAEKYFPGRSAVGQEISFGGPPEKDSDWPVIVGVVETAAFGGLEDRSGTPYIYMPLKQIGVQGISIFVRPTGSVTEMLARVRQKIREIDPTMPLYGTGTLQMRLDGTLENRRGVLLLLATFAGLALLLSAVGIYGVLAYDVSQRTREIGVRSAIGASPGQIMRLILRQGLGKAGIGLAIGLVGAFCLSRFMTGLLFDVRPSDPVAYLAVSLLLLLVALLASWLPARRAAKVDPVVALRCE